MTGSIIKRGKGTYLLRLSLGRDEQTGKRLYRTATFHGTKKEAEQALRDMVNRYEAGGVVSSDRVSVNAYLQEWLKVAKKNSVAERTFQNYSAHIDRYVAKTIGRLPLAKISVADIQGLYESLADQGLGAPTIKLVHTILNQAFKQAVRWRKMNYNPAADTERPRGKRVCFPPFPLVSGDPGELWFEQNQRRIRRGTSTQPRGLATGAGRGQKAA